MRRVRGQTRARVDDRRDEGMKCEYRGGGEARQHRNRLAFDDGETERLARLKRDAMDKNPRIAKPCDDLMGKVAGAF